MRIMVTLAMGGMLAAGCEQDAAATTAPTPIPVAHKIVALGDSLTSGHGMSRTEAFPAVLERTLAAAGLPFTVVNHGVSGDTTADGVRRLGAALSERPAILIVALGANDGLRGVPVTHVRANLETIIETTQAQGVNVLLCGMDALPLYGWQYTVDFHGIFPALAEKYDVPLVPFLLDGVVGNRDMLLPDMIHPNAAGATQIASNIWPYLQPLAAALAVQATG